MFLCALALATIGVISAAWYFGARLFTLIYPENQAWSSLWAACLLGALLSPFVGLGVMLLAPQEVATLAEGLSLHADGLVAQELGDLRTQIEARVPLFDARAALNLGLVVYALGAALHLGRLLVGRWRVRQIAQHPAFLVPLGEFRVSASPRAHAPFVWTPLGRRANRASFFPFHILNDSPNLSSTSSHNMKTRTSRAGMTNLD